MGNLGADPDVKVISNNQLMTTFSLATSDAWKDKQTGEKQEKTEWHRIVLFQRLAEIARDYLKKGAKVYIEGKLQTRKWQDKSDGQDHFITEIVCKELQMLDSRTDKSADPSTTLPSTPDELEENIDDEIPF